jgi:hypothetical protein
MFRRFMLCSVPFHNNQRGILSLSDRDFKVFFTKPGGGGRSNRQGICIIVSAIGCKRVALSQIFFHAPRAIFPLPEPAL